MRSAPPRLASGDGAASNPGGGTFAPGVGSVADNTWHLPAAWLADVRDGYVAHWRVFCEPDRRNCVAIQTLDHATAGTVIVMVHRSPGTAAAVLSIGTPRETAFDRGLTFRVGNRQATMRQGFFCYETTVRTFS